MTRIIANVASFFTRIFEDYVSSSEIKDFVLNNFKTLKFEDNRREDSPSELIEIKTNLAILGWIKQDVSKQTENQEYDGIDKSNVIQWFKDLKDGKIIEKGIIAEGTGANLDWLDENNEDLQGFTAMALESILRFAEVKRKKIINAFSQKLTYVEKTREGLRLSILLSRTSRRHKDLRYLNAAFKMNDWYYPIFRSAHSEESLIHYLLALTEQERSAAEILK